MNHKMRIQQTLLVSLLIVISAQVNFGLFHTEFKISMGILMYSAAVAMFGEYKVIPVTALSAVGVLLSRTLLYWLKWGILDFGHYVPEVIFYLVYGIIFFAFCKMNQYKITMWSAPVLFLSDCTANLVELIFRVPTYTIDWQTIFSIFLIAILRTATIMFILWCLNYYKFSLLKREHAERYRKLLMLISRLNDEVVLMQKNRKMMENTMSTSYKLFQEMEKSDVDPRFTKTALDIAKDVHELKKEYSLILRGLSEAMDLDTKEEGMYLQDIFRVLHHSMKQNVPADKTMELEFDYEENLYTEQHYFVLSVLRNLVNNAIEASDKEEIHIDIKQSSKGDVYLFTVQDNGPGIEKEDMENIFLPGFSTKINFETGEVNRGLGLELVKDLVENRWSGAVCVESSPGKTIFTIQIPKEKWKENS